MRSWLVLLIARHTSQASAGPKETAPPALVWLPLTNDDATVGARVHGRNTDVTWTVGPAMRQRRVTLLLAVLVGACSQSGEMPSTMASRAASLAPSPGPTATGPVDSSAIALEEAERRWEKRHASSYAFTLARLGPPGHGWDSHYRVTVLAGHVEVAQLDGLTLSTGADELGIDGLFDSIRAVRARPGGLLVTFDPDLGYPALVTYLNPNSSDGDSSQTITDFRSAADREQDRTEASIRAGLKAWKLWEPRAYEYVWRLFTAADGPGSGTAWVVRRADGRTSATADPVSDLAIPADAASITSTLDRVASELDAGAWVDLTVDPISGVPKLVGVDPSTAIDGDEYWIRIDFTDTERQQAVAALEAAKDRWSSAGLRRYSYTWRYRGDLDPLTYFMTFDGERAAVRRSPGTPIPEARAYATPRMDDTFALLEGVLAQGGRITATYDPKLGFPVRVEVQPAGDLGARGVITLEDFVTTEP